MMCFTDPFYVKKSLQKMDLYSFARIKPKPVQGCSSELAAAVVTFSAAVTLSHTSYSRRYSLWSLVAIHIDEAAENCMRLSTQTLSEEHSFSKHAKQLGCNSTIEVLRLINKRQENTQIYSDFETLIEILNFIKSRSPHEQIERFANVDENPFCELCWRFTMAYNQKIQDEDELWGSPRYCKQHNPCDPHSLYRNDHRFRKSYEIWLGILGGYVELPPFQSPDKEQIKIRKEAYKLSQIRITKRRKEILELLINGATQSEISRQLGISRQAVYNSLLDIREQTTNWSKIARLLTVAELLNKK